MYGRDARVVAGATARVDARHRRRRSSLSAVFLYPYVGKELVPDDDQSEFSVNVRLPRGTSFDAHATSTSTPIEQESCAQALGDQRRRDDDVDPERQRQLFGIQLTPLEERDAVAAGADAGRARALLQQVPGARGSACRAAPTSPARRRGGGGGGRGGGGGGGGGTQPAAA